MAADPEDRRGRVRAARRRPHPGLHRVARRHLPRRAIRLAGSARCALVQRQQDDYDERWRRDEKIPGLPLACTEGERDQTDDQRVNQGRGIRFVAGHERENPPEEKPTKPDDEPPDHDDKIPPRQLGLWE